MKKSILFLISLVVLILTVSACSNSDTASTTDEGVEEEVIIEEPVSDVTGGSALQGTWRMETTTENASTTLILALNSDNTFAFYQHETNDDLEGTALGTGTYTTEGETLTLTVNETEQSSDDLYYTPIFSENPTYTYILEGNTLTLTSSGGQTYVFNRS